MTPHDTDQARFAPLAPAATAVIVVLIAYVWYASSGFGNLRQLITPDNGYFALQADGFMHGHLYLGQTPDPRLVALPNPYDPRARTGIDYLWDASFFRGKYYLYFSPVPILFVYLPYQKIFGNYPPDVFAAFVFGVWAFLASVLCVDRALRGLNRTFVPQPIWILLLGFGTLIPFTFAEIRIYEVSVLAGAAMTATWAWSLMKMIESPTTARITWTSIWLALSIAARPNLGVLLFVTALTIYAVACNRKTLVRMMRVALVPLGIVALMMLAYNAGRFGKVLEFGHRYQLTAVNMKGKKVCRLCNLSDATRLGNSLAHYVFWPVSIRTTFPLLKVEHADLDPAASFPGNEEVIGVALVVPLTLVATLLAIVLALTRERLTKGAAAGLHLMLGAWLVIGGLSTCWYVVARYEIDFMLLIVAATVVCIESGLEFLHGSGVRLFPLRVIVALLALYSILVGVLLGFVGRDGAFRKFHPELFNGVAQALHLKGF